MHDGPHGPIIARPSAITGSMFTSPGSSTQVTNQPPSVGFNEGQVDPGLMSGVMQVGGMSAQEANKIAQQAMGNTGQGFGITGTGNFGQVTSGQETGDTSATGDFEDDSEASSGDDPYIPPKKPDKDKNIVDAIMGNTMVAGLLKGVQSTDRFFKALAEKGPEGLSTEDKIILANLIGAGGLDKINIDKYADKYDVDVTDLGKKFTQAASGLENVDYESLVNSYLSNKPTGIDSLTTMGSDLSNLFGDPRLLREDGSYTLEGLQKELGPQGIAYLKATNPKLYYSFTDPQTSGGLEELAQFDLSTLGGSPEDRQLAARVVAAREATSGQGGGGGAGIPSLPQVQSTDITMMEDKMDITKPGYTGDPKNPFGLPGDYGSGFIESEFYKPGTPGFGVMTPVKLPDGTTHMFPDSSSANQFQQYLDDLAMNKMGPSTGIPQAVETSTGIPSLTPTTINYASMAPQFGPQYRGYVNQGINDPQFASYFKNLQMFPRIV